jgi:hypothetical protein
MLLGIGDVRDVPVGAGDSYVTCVPDIPCCSGIGDVWDVPVGVGSCYVTCVPFKQCR